MIEEPALSGSNDATTCSAPRSLIFRTLVRRNLDAMIAMAGGADRLRPHVKTHKMPAIVRIVRGAGHPQAQVRHDRRGRDGRRRGGHRRPPGVSRSSGRTSPASPGWSGRTPRPPSGLWSTTPTSAAALSEAMQDIDRPLAGPDRPGGRHGPDRDRSRRRGRALWRAGRRAAEPGARRPLTPTTARSTTVRPTARSRGTTPGVEQTLELRDRLLALGLPVPRLVLGGTPTFPDPRRRSTRRGGVLAGDLHAARRRLRRRSYPDLPFTPAAVLLTRVISRPGPGRICLDLGHKAVAADPVGARLDPARPPRRDRRRPERGAPRRRHPARRTYPPGTPFLALPTHICPTCALHRRAYVIEDGELVDEWVIRPATGC